MRLITGLMHNVLLTLLLESHISRVNYPENVKIMYTEGELPWLKK